MSLQDFVNSFFISVFVAFVVVIQIIPFVAAFVPSQLKVLVAVLDYSWI